MLLLSAHLAESARVAVGQEHRVVAEAGGPARRPDQRAVDARLELLQVTVRPDDAERRDEVRLALRRRCGAAGAQRLVDLSHGATEILLGARPAGRTDTGLAAKRV